MIDSKTALYGVIGNPVSHSLSPVMQNIALRETRTNAVYLAFPIRKEQISNFLQSAEVLGVKGINVTLPYKSSFLPQVTKVSARSSYLNSINTLSFTSEGWYGDSTDGEGFLRSLREENINVRGKQILLFGAGGSAKSIAYSLGEAGAKSVYIKNRTVKTAKKLAEKLNTKFSDTFYTEGNPKDGSHILINSTSVGLNDDALSVDPEQIKNTEVVADIIYTPIQTRLLKTAAEHSKKCINGLGMLVHQGACSFEIWFEKKAPVDLMRKSLEKILR